MSNPKLLAQLWQLSPAKKVEMMQFLTAELTKKQGLKSLDNDVVYRFWSPYNYGDAAQKLMILLEQKEAKKMRNNFLL